VALVVLRALPRLAAPDVLPLLVGRQGVEDRYVVGPLSPTDHAAVGRAGRRVVGEPAPALLPVGVEVDHRVPLGRTGNETYEPCSPPTHTSCRATAVAVAANGRSPVLGFTSKRGK